MTEMNRTVPFPRTLIVYVLLTCLIIAVYGQVYNFDFVNMDDSVYVTDNSNIFEGFTTDSIRWAFTTTHAEFWHPLTWLSLMADYQLYGLHASGYHLTNLILHILSSLLLFWLFCRMTGAVWRSAFVAGLFALHPLHVESVAWIAERKDVLSAFFWMLTLCLYVYYTEKPAKKRYVPVLFSFVCGLMSKPMVVTLPVILILLDYWPLNRFAARKDNPFLWQLKEKLPFFLLSAVFSIIAIHAQPKLPINGWPFPLEGRIVNALVSFVIRLEKTFVPQDLTILYPFYGDASLWQALGAALIILSITAAVLLTVKRFPYLFVGWLWYGVALLPVMGIIPSGNNAMADRYHYLPSIGLSIMLAWGIPALIKDEETRKKILFPAAVAVLIILSILTSRQCVHWKNSVALFQNSSRIIKNNPLVQIDLGNALSEKGRHAEAIVIYHQALVMIPPMPDNIMAYNDKGMAYNKLRQLAHLGLGRALAAEGKLREAVDHYTVAISMSPVTPENIAAFNQRGNAYDKLGQTRLAINDFSEAIRLNPKNVTAFNNRGKVFAKLGFYQRALDDFDAAIRLKPSLPDTYNNRGVAFAEKGFHQQAVSDFDKAIRLNRDYADAFLNRGIAYLKQGSYQRAFDDFNKAIKLKPDDADAYAYRGGIYLGQGSEAPGCTDVRTACRLGNCEILKSAQARGLCLEDR